MTDSIPLHVTESAPWLKQSYARLALISHTRHLAQLDAGDTDTLIVATDWLLWQRALRQRRHAVHFEHLLAEVPAERQPLIELPKRAMRWLRDGAGRDLTRFKGVSLGQVYVRQMILATQAVERLWCGLDRLCLRFRPRQLVLFDLRGDLDMVEDAQKRLLAQQLARRHGLELVDWLDPVPAGDAEFPNPLIFRPPAEPRLRTLLRGLYARAISAVFHVRWLMRGRPPKLLMLLDVHQVRGLLNSFDRTDFAPVIDAGTVPKSLSFLREVWRKGFVLAYVPPGRLSAKDRRALDAIAATVRAQPGEGDLDEVVLEFVRRRLLVDGSLASTARLVNRMRNFLQSCPVQGALVGDSDHAGGRVTAELGAQSGVAVAEAFNGILFTDWPTPSRCGDGQGPAPLARILAWGEHCRTWLSAIGSPVPVEVTGNPSLDALAPVPPHQGTERRALILPPYSIELDPGALSGSVGPALVELVEELRRRGFDQIRIKVHPGHQNPEYYRTLLMEFGHDLPVFGAGSVHAHVEWADVVVGPPTSGAMAECLALGRPYYPLAPLPGALNYGYLPFLKVFTSAAEIGAALDAGWAPDGDAVLAGLCARQPGRTASARVWQALAGMMGKKN